MTTVGFWQALRTDNRDIIRGPSGLGEMSRAFYLFPQGGGPRGPFTFSTFAALKPLLKSRDVVILGGVLREQVVAPIVYDVTIIGAANDNRQSTSGGVPTGGGASWLAPTSPVATTPLIRVVAQGWRFINIQMAPVAGAACITFDRRETTAIPDSSHGSVENCYFSTGGASGFGIEIIDCKKIRIEGNIFEALTGASGTAIKRTAGSGIADISHCSIRNNRFVQNVNDIDCPMNFGLIEGNFFNATNPIEGGKRVVINGGTGRNRVLNNAFSDVAADVTIAKGYTPGANDVWRNWTSNTNVPIVTVPA